MIPPSINNSPRAEQLRSQLTDVMSVDSVTTLREPPDAIAFRGQLHVDSDKAFELIEPRFEAAGYTPLLRHTDGHDIVTAMPGRVIVSKSDPRINLILFVATVASTFITGAMSGDAFNIADGILFSVSMLTILGAHELGHYFVARHYNAPVTLPYFIPVPIISPMGTLGAVIKLKAPFVNRKTLFDVGIAGPLAGLVFAIPILLIGLSMSTVGQCPVPGQCMQEGNSLVYAAAKFLVFGRFLPAGPLDVQISPVAWAGWVGLFVTAINLLPAGQLDGGHVTFALFGTRAALLGRITVVILAILSLPALLPQPLDLSFLGVPGLNYPGYIGWIVWVGLIFLTGVQHPVPLNDISDIGPGRKALGVLAIILFILLFTPLPFSVS